jgi:ATP-binding cassette subfamily F protein 3
VLIVSHDRTFLDATITRTLILDPDSHTLRDFAGNYTTYTETHRREIDHQWQAYQDQQDEILRLQNASRRLRGQAVMKRGGKADSGDKFAKGYFSDQSAGSMGRAKHIERRLERLMNEERIDKPSQHWQLKVDFAHDDSGAREVLRLENLAMGFGERMLFSDVNLTLTQGQRIAFIGPNGMGKTTLLRLITGELAPTNGAIHIGSGVKMGYASQEQELLKSNLTPYDTIRAEVDNMDQTDIRRFLHFFLFAEDEVFIKVGDLSFGERARLMLALLVAQGCNFLLLDEPVNHLDIPSRERFEQALLQFPGTVLAVVHDRMFIQNVATGIWELREGRIQFLHTD